MGKRDGRNGETLVQSRPHRIYDCRPMKLAFHSVHEESTCGEFEIYALLRRFHGGVPRGRTLDKKTS